MEHDVRNQRRVRVQSLVQRNITNPEERGCGQNQGFDGGVKCCAQGAVCVVFGIYDQQDLLPDISFRLRYFKSVLVT